MSNLTIEFRQMFLLVNRTNGATVLVPSQNHQATLVGPPTMFKEPITLTQADVIVRRDGADLADMPTLRPGARYLPYLDYVFHATVEPLPEAKSATVPSNLNARVLLAGGFMTELPASDAKVADLMWDFIKPDGRVTLKQALTDRVLFTLPLDEGVTYELIVRMNGVEQSWTIPSDGAALVLLNADTMKKKAIDGLHRLTEYAILYNLTSASEFATLYPIPTAHTSGVGGGDQPICGGGQSDGGDDPPPGPPPPGR